MALFQKSVLNKFIKSQDTVKIEAAYQRFSDNFQKAERQAEIRSMKEEEYQDGFLDDLFVNILGYIKRPNTGFNLVREKKNEADSKKADGAILKNDIPLAVIELKGTDTTDLDKVTNQGFGYKNNHKECVYVVISNFEKLRFFIHHAVDYIEFNLFTLSKEEFTTLWLCLHADNLLDNIPAKIKAESVVKEEDITKNLYKDYSSFKQELWQSIVNLNPEGDPLTYYKKTQKLIDRFLFIFFAEDVGLLPPNSISRMVDRWKMLKEEDAYKPLYEIFKQYFGYINIGRPGKTAQDEIFAYNGGLFLEDHILDTVTISDEVLLKHTLKLTVYDFSSEVDVNILGHIFENSLNDIEAVTAELEGKEIDKSKTKRKKDGVFYTPKYITKYIVENTVGKLCDEKKVELNIIDEEYAKGRTNRKKETLKQLDENLQAYRNWLLNITICDPACGSGAFLNQALEYLMEEHRYIDELESQLLGAGFKFPGVENHILENNIFGVDINDESIEIAKLSLWLRTAQRGRKLTSLNNNIKCGNSLIDDPEVAGEKAFNWQQEFPTVFEKGGFDVVIGNPPYVRQELFKEFKPYLETHYKCYNSVADLYTYFMELGLKIMNGKGKFSFILPNKFLKATYGTEIRQVLKNNSVIESLFDFDDYPVFPDATTYPIIFILSKDLKQKNDFFYYSEINNRLKTEDPIESLESKKIKVPFNSLTDEMWNFIKEDSLNLINKLHNNAISLNEFVNKKIYRGLTTGKNEAFVIDELKKEELIGKSSENSDLIKILATGKEVKRNSFNFQNKYLLFTGYDINIPMHYPDIQKELDIFQQDLIKRYDQGLNYWNLRACAYYSEMAKPKIIYPRINNQGNFYFDAKGDIYLLDNNFFISSDSVGLVGLLNSKLIFYFLKNVCTTLQGGFYDFRRDKISTIPINRKFISSEETLGRLSENLIKLTANHESVISKFQRTVKRKFEFDLVSKKIQDWSTLSFKEFILELNKKKIKLSLSEEAQWEDYFNEEKQNALELKSQIDQTDKEIDRMVYELYGLTQEEILIVENS